MLALLMLCFGLELKDNKVDYFSEANYESYRLDNKVVYGDDERRDLFELKDAHLGIIARSTAAMVDPARVSFSTEENVVLRNISLGDQFKVCPSERFYNQPVSASCSGFLVAPDVLVTAGHCVTTASDCNKFLWIFDYSMPLPDYNPLVINRNNVYRCSKIVSNRATNSDDYAIIKLDRKVTDRNPLKVRSSGKIANNDKIYIIGHPSGLPTKYADMAIVRNNSSTKFFNANLDSFGGNSGSAVFNATSNIVEGILIRGDVDYIYDRERSCRKVNICRNEGCTGEDVYRITNINHLINY